MRSRLLVVVLAAVVAPCVAAVATVGAVAASTAVSATPVTITSAGHVDGHPKVTWALPPGWSPSVINIASKPDVGSDGSFFSENIVDGGILRTGQTEFLSSVRLRAGIYFVRVHASADDYPDIGWTETATLTIAPPPPLPPPMPPSRVVRNGNPTISNVRWAMDGHNPVGPRYYVTVTARFRLCDDRGGRMVFRRSERSHLGGRTSATAAATSVRRLSNRCVAAAWTWRLADKFFGIGNYTVRLWVTDAKKAKSNVITRNWYTRD
jgi:hypothetical protein